MLLAERLRSEEEKAAMRVVLEEQVNIYDALFFSWTSSYIFAAAKTRKQCIDQRSTST